jgi:predicted Zn-dependent protease
MTLKKVYPVTVMFGIGLALGSSLVLANHAWICTGSTAYHWASRTVYHAAPVEEKPAGRAIGRNPQSYINAFNGAITVWDGTVINLASGSNLKLYYDTYGNNGWLGLGTIYVSGCVITRATSKLNDSYLRNTSRYSQTNVNHVACQEVGHTFGLDHNRSATNTCMNDQVLTAGNQINQHDKDQLASIYANIP